VTAVRAEAGPSGITLDTGALVALERDDRRMRALMVEASRGAWRVTIPVGALAQAVRVPQRQVRLFRLIRSRTTDVADLTMADAIAVGQLLRRTGTADIVDAHVVLCAARAGQAIVTSDPKDLRRLDPQATLIAL
jgi:hypothetical protein